MNADQLSAGLQPHLSVTRVEIDGEGRSCWVLDWARRDDELAEMFSDMFGDGSPDGFEMGDADTLIPFAVLGMTGRDDDRGQPEGVLFCDTAAAGAVVSFAVDGTALVHTRRVLAPSLAALKLGAA